MAESQPEEDAIVAEEALVETVETDVKPAEATEIQSEESETQEEKPSDSSPEEGKETAKQRIEKLNSKWRTEQRKNREIEADRDHWKKEAEKSPKPEVNVKTLADFDYDEAAYTSHVLEVARTEAAQNYQNEGARETQNRKLAEFRTNESIYAESHDDYYNVTNREGLTVTDAMATVIKDSDMGPAVLHHLGNNVDLSQQIAQLPPVTMAREIGKIEAILGQVKGKAVSDAPAPAPKLKTVDNTVEKDPDKMSQAEYGKWRRKRIANR